MADIVLLAADRFAFDGATTGAAVSDVPAGSTPGAHGYINTDNAMNAAFVASGAGIKKSYIKAGYANGKYASQNADKLLKAVKGRILVLKKEHAAAQTKITERGLKNRRSKQHG